MKRLLIAAALVAVTGCSNNQGPKTIAFECTGSVEKEEYRVRFVIDPATERGNGTVVFQGGKPVDLKELDPWTVEAKFYPKTIEITEERNSGSVKTEMSLNRKTGELLKFEEFTKGYGTFASWEWEKDPVWKKVKCKRVS